jgi:hypothetical protein
LSALDLVRVGSDCTQASRRREGLSTNPVVFLDDRTMRLKKAALNRPAGHGS